MFAKIKHYIDNVIHIERVYNSTPLDERHGFVMTVVKYATIFKMSVIHFSSSLGTLRASALSFYALFSLVPIFALIFGISKGFGMDNAIKELMAKYFSDSPEMLDKLYTFADTTLQQARGGVVAGFGLIMLFWLILRMLNYIEKSINGIWGVTAGRGIFRRFGNYLAVIIICPVLLILTSSSTVYVHTILNDMVANAGVFSRVGIIIREWIFMLVPYVVAWVLFIFLYTFIPNTKVKFSAALFGGVVAGTIFQLVQNFYIGTQVWLSSYNAIYGSFAIIPLFLLWMQLSWLIVLYGAELAFIHQNIDSLEFGDDGDEPLSCEFSFKLGLFVTHLVVERFEKGEVPPSMEELARESGVSIRVISPLVEAMVKAGLVNQVVMDAESQSYAYAPALDPEKMTTLEIFVRLSRSGRNRLPTNKFEAMRGVTSAVKGMHDVLADSKWNKSIEQIR